jgi:hypothetical protein
VPLGAELGGRGNAHSERNEQGRILYRSIAESAEFREGLSRIESGTCQPKLLPYPLSAGGGHLAFHAHSLRSPPADSLLAHGMSAASMTSRTAANTDSRSVPRASTWSGTACRLLVVCPLRWLDLPETGQVDGGSAIHRKTRRVIPVDLLAFPRKWSV